MSNLLKYISVVMQVRKQSWVAMSSVALNSGIFRCAIAITRDFLGAQ